MADTPAVSADGNAAMADFFPEMISPLEAMTEENCGERSASEV